MIQILLYHNISWYHHGIYSKYCCGNGDDKRNVVSVCLDGYDQSPTYDKARFTPRCVGADGYLPKWGWSHLNATFLQNRQHEDKWCLVSSSLTEEEEQDAVNNGYKIPLFDNRGNAMVRVVRGLRRLRRCIVLLLCLLRHNRSAWKDLFLNISR